MILAVPRETAADERRVALIPDTVARLIKLGLQVHVESGAGAGASHSDAAYRAAGAQIITDRHDLWRRADVLVKVRPPEGAAEREEIALLRAGAVLIGLLNPLGNPECITQLVAQNVTALAMELIPRISRAQSMDALSSQASVAGYKAVLLAANQVGKFFPMLTTAAGTVRPAQVFILGAGVAGLQAIATARRLGATVKAFDIRPVVKEQVESLGAEFVGLSLEEETETSGGYAKEVSVQAKAKEQALITEHLKTADVVITTALVPGKAAPRLISTAMVEQMAAGAVIVDLAAEQGGNCEPSEANVIKEHKGVCLLAPLHLPAQLPIHASQLYARNIRSLLELIIQDGTLRLDFADEIIATACVTHEGRLRTGAHS